jgi:putative phosphoribosyl transferase
VALNPAIDQHEVRIDPPGLSALLGVPPDAKGVVLFAHGSGSGRKSPRNNHVAESLRLAGIATLLLDLLTPAEEQDRRNVFDVELLASRLIQATHWIEDQRPVRGLPVGYFGASTGAGAALVAAAAQGRQVAAVVSRGGRPDLAGDALADVKAPTLLLVGGLDTQVIELNHAAATRMRCEFEVTIVPGASHLFEEPGTLDQVIHHACTWFLRHFAVARGKEARHDRPPADLR